MRKIKKAIAMIFASACSCMVIGASNTFTYEKNDSEDDYKVFDKTEIYQKGDIVYNDGTYWICNWYSNYEEPKRTGHSLCWSEYMPVSDSGLSEWSPDVIYDRGQLVTYQDEIWQCQWWSDYAVPGTTGKYGCWKRYVEQDNTYCEENAAYLDLIGTYYSYMNSGERENIRFLFASTLNKDYDRFFANELNRKTKTGLWNIKEAEIESVKEIQPESLEYTSQYSEVKAFLVKAKLSVYKQDDYSWNGTNYYVFTIGKENGMLKIVAKTMPIINSEVITENDDNASDIDEYYSNIYETAEETKGNAVSLLALSTVDQTATVDPDKYKGKNWSDLRRTNIKIYLEAGSGSGAVTSSDVSSAKRNNSNNEPIISKNFKSYCKIVTNTEYGDEGKGQAAYDAMAMCVKNFGMHCYFFAGDLGYDVKTTTAYQAYKPHKTMLSNCETAVNNTWDYVMLTKGYGLFKACYKKNTSYSDYCVRGGGQLNQEKLYGLAREGNTWRQILHYFYDSGIYNKFTAKGDIRIVDVNCSHKYSGTSKKCTICGCSKK